ncbi:MAG TPA: aldose 1-epimerase family protein [Spirochaetia bacterium]|nr:aldose 1-epimerase family protein [Spirochaetia bacterium]
MRVAGKEYTRREAERRIGNLRQLGGIRHCELSEGRARGVRTLEVTTGSGLAFTILPDRGLDIADFSYKGINLVYHTSSGIAHPTYYDPAQSEWLRIFFGGLLTTCGLTYFGQPGRDGDENLGLHGRYSALPATRVNDLSRWEADEYRLEVTGTIEEAVLFGDKLRLTRSISTSIGSRSLRIWDRVQNFGARSSPFTILYHINAGFPLLDETSELVAAARGVEPYDERSARGRADANRFASPKAEYNELNFLHTMAADEHGYTRAAFINRDLAGGMGLGLRYSTATIPYLSEWKMLADVDYVVGMEPVNTKIANRAELRAAGRLPILGPGEIREMDLELSVLEGKAEIDSFCAEVKRIQGRPS